MADTSGETESPDFKETSLEVENVKFSAVASREQFEIIKRRIKHFIPIDYLLIKEGSLAQMGPAAFAVLTTIIAYRNYKSGLCYPGIRSIALKSGVSKNTVSRAIKRLKKLGFLTWKQRRAGKVRLLSSQYYPHPLTPRKVVLNSMYGPKAIQYDHKTRFRSVEWLIERYPTIALVLESRKGDLGELQDTGLSWHLREEVGLDDEDANMVVLVFTWHLFRSWCSEFNFQIDWKPPKHIPGLIETAKALDPTNTNRKKPLEGYALSIAQFLKWVESDKDHIKRLNFGILPKLAWEWSEGI